MAVRFKLELALAVILATAALQGCASGQSAEAYGVAGANTGTVYVSRPSQFAGLALSMNVNVDGNAVGSIGNGQCIRVTLPAGRHAINGSNLWANVFSANRGVVHVDVRPGSSTHVLITPTVIMPGQYFIFPASVTTTGRRC